jgi:hypothetical protein
MESQIKAGDVVYLKSEFTNSTSNPSLTVSSITGNVASCWYFNKLTQDYVNVSINVNALRTA